MPHTSENVGIIYRLKYTVKNNKENDYSLKNIQSKNVCIRIL